MDGVGRRPKRRFPPLRPETLLLMDVGQLFLNDRPRMLYRNSREDFNIKTSLGLAGCITLPRANGS
jgi:hypothetical protein